MKKANTSRKAKRISIRRYLPIGVRVHYDVVRNFAPIKLVGLSVMVMIAVFGILLATQTVSPASEASAVWEEATVQHQYYDWGSSKPGGQGAEDKHRASLDEHFSLETKQAGNSLSVRVSVPPSFTEDLTLRPDVSVSYSVEEVLQRLVSQPNLCDQNSWNAASELTLSENAASIGLTSSDNGKHYCFKVKLLGDVSRTQSIPAADSHAEWVFVTNPLSTTTTTTIVTPEVSVALSPGSIATKPYYIARDTAGNAASANTWHHIVVSSSSACSSSAFSLPPTDRDLRKSGSSWRPTSQEITDYQGKYICFRASNSAGTDFGYMWINLSGTTTPLPLPLPLPPPLL